ncbi:MAG: hypothetical protein HYY17_10050 [Planctomycetes bacterium]|nr:hypothetical protein [Planctomycetota bacterium]
MDDEKRRSRERHVEILRRATPDERLRAASAQRRISLELLKAGLLARSPGLTDREVEDRMGEIVFGVEVWREIRERRQRRRPGPGSA